jgi:translation initiation factor IF-3
MAQTVKSNVNEKIRSPRILLIDENGNNLGTIQTRDALRRAQESGLDLVEVNSGEIPICKIMDFGKFKYEQIKKNKQNAKNQTVVITKEIKFRPNTGDNDLLYRAKQVDQFLKDKNRVKLSVRFRGREIEHISSVGKNLIDKFLGMLQEEYIMEMSPRTDGGFITLLLIGK